MMPVVEWKSKNATAPCPIDVESSTAPAQATPGAGGARDSKGGTGAMEPKSVRTLWEILPDRSWRCVFRFKDSCLVFRR